MDSNSSIKAETASNDHASNANGNESKKESRGGGESGRSGRRDRGRRRRSRSPIRSREDRQNKITRRVYVANIPFDVRWGELKDLFREKVGSVRFCQLFENEEGKPRGCGLVEFEDSALAKKAIEVLNRYEFKGRELVVKEDLDIERDRFGRLVVSSKRGERERPRRSHYEDHYRNGSGDSGSTAYNTYGLSPQFLESLGIRGPLNNRVFVANLDYKVNDRKLEDIFSLAGKVTKVRLYADQDGKSKGFGIVEFEHPVEAVQAISMFNNQKLYDRVLSIRLDKFDPDEVKNDDYGLPSKLPKGLEGIGKGLGIGGQPLNISKSMITSPSMAPMGSVQQSPVSSSVPPNNVAPQAASAAINALTNLAGNLQNLPSLAQSLAHLSNSPAMGSSSMPTGGYCSPSVDLAPPPSGAPAYSGYSSMGPSVPVAPAPAAQPVSYSATALPHSANYGPSPSTPVGHGHGPYPGTSSNTSSISSYSTYDQRDYREEQYRSNPGIDTILVRNLPLSFNWQNLRDRFNEVGEVRFAEMKGHGTAIVRFATDRDAQRAVDLMNGIRIENRPIEVILYY